MKTDYEPTAIERDVKPIRYFRNAVERHWDPHDIELDQDRKNILERLEDGRMEKSDFLSVCRQIANFGAGEEAVTEDLAPFITVHEDINDQMFLTTHMYEEAKHADFFDKYWAEVINEVEAEMGWELTSADEDRWYADAYIELFDRIRKAMYRSMEEPTDQNLGSAYVHYMLVAEGMLAQTGYWIGYENFSGDYEELPHLPGLHEGLTKIRQDEGRHTGFGMYKLKQLIADGRITEQFVKDEVEMLMDEVVMDLMSGEGYDDSDAGVSDEAVAEYTMGKHSDRMNQILDDTTEVPDVEELVTLESGKVESDD